MVPHKIKASILAFIHLIWHSYNSLMFALICLYYYLLTSIEEANKTCDYINIETIKNVPFSRDLRVPKHVALLFTNEADHLDLASIARLLCWCKQLKIDYVTIYDDLGRIKDRQKELSKYIKIKIESLESKEPIDQIEGLNIISRIDGRQKFLDDVKELVSKHDPNCVNMAIVQNLVGWPTDPELLISFGNPLCLYGFPPWQLRLTEIFTIPTHRRMPQKVFIDCLQRYSRTVQREGV